MFVRQLFVVTLVLAGARADYECLCNYNVEAAVYLQPSESGQAVGYLYEFDCKAIYESAAANAEFAKIAFEHQIGYVKLDANMESQTCPGEPPSSDRVTTTIATTTLAPTTTTTPKPTTTTTTPRPTTTTTTPKPTTTTTTPRPTTTTTTPKPTTTPTTTTTTTTTPKPTTTSTTTTTTTTTPRPTTTTTPVPTTTKPDCSHDKADIVFLLDSSYSEGEPNFRKQLAFVSNFTTPYDIGPDKVQVSVVTFSTATHNAFYLNTYRDRASLLNGINNVRYTPGSTSTDKALEFVRSTSFSPLHGARLGVPKILVVMTDGQSTSPTLTAQKARILHFSDIKVISIGIGSGVVKTELTSIASDAQHVFTVPSFNSLQTIQTDIRSAACTSEKIDASCTQKQADVVFVLDTSGSEGAVNFDKQLQFVANVTNSFDIGPSNIQVSVVTFGTHAYNEFFLNEYGDRPSLQTAINNITYRGGTTNTADALYFVSTNSFKAENGGRGGAVVRLVVVLTDGNSNSAYSTQTAANHLHALGVRVISVGIGAHVSQTELAHIANDPQHVLNVADFNSLNSITTEIETVACTTPSPCGDHPADIVFLLDSSSSEGAANFQKQLDFMTNFVRQFDIGPSDVQVGLVTFSSSAHSEFYLNSHRDKASLIAAIQSVRYRGGSTATDQALRFARYYHFASYHGARPNATRIVIVLTDGQSTDISATITEASSLKTQAHATVIAIGIGSNVNQFELNNVATDRNHVFSVGSFSILHTLQVELKDQSCGNPKPKPAVSTDCGKEPADIVFVLDSSASEGSINFQKQLDFVRDFAYQFNIGPSEVLVSVVTFSSGAHEQFPLNRYTNQKDLLAAVARITYNSGVTYTDKALQYVRLNSFLASKGARANATDLVILLTDGQSTHPTDTAREADLLKNRTNVKVVAIGIGSGVHTTELRRIASDDSHAFAVANFDSLNTIKSELTYVTCQTCGFVSKADIVFILDASSSEGSLNFHSQLDFVSRVVNDFQVGPHNVHIGVLTFSDQPHLAFKLNEHSSKNTVLDAIQRVPYIQGLTNTDQALQYARTTMFTSAGGARSDAQHYAVVLTDGASSNSAQTLQQATLLKQQHVTVIAIGIGDNLNNNELSSIASDSNHVFTVSDFNALRTLQSDIKAAACEEIKTTPAPKETVIG